jgi:hypothetical protein
MRHLAQRSNLVHGSHLGYRTRRKKRPKIANRLAGVQLSPFATPAQAPTLAEEAEIYAEISGDSPGSANGLERPGWLSRLQLWIRTRLLSRK